MDLSFSLSIASDASSPPRGWPQQRSLLLTLSRHSPFPCSNLPLYLYLALLLVLPSLISTNSFLFPHNFYCLIFIVHYLLLSPSSSLPFLNNKICAISFLLHKYMYCCLIFVYLQHSRKHSRSGVLKVVSIDPQGLMGPSKESMNNQGVKRGQ